MTTTTSTTDQITYCAMLVAWVYQPGLKAETMQWAPTSMVDRSGFAHCELDNAASWTNSKDAQTAVKRMVKRCRSYWSSPDNTIRLAECPDKAIMKAEIRLITLRDGIMLRSTAIYDCFTGQLLDKPSWWNR